MKHNTFPLLPFFYAISLAQEENIDYWTSRIPLDYWLSLKHVTTVEESTLDCGEGCNQMFDTDHSCNAFIFDESTNICTRALYTIEPPLELRGTGLRVAWASSIYGSPYNEEKLMDRILENFFHSAEMLEQFPWIAIDLVWPEVVTKVEMIKRDTYEFRTHDIEVRVGPEKPFERRTNKDTLYKDNPVCGVYKGPGKPGTESSVTCSEPLTGRYITLQKIVPQPLGESINLGEIIIESSPMMVSGNQGNTIEILLREHPITGECPSDHPHAYDYGYRCCSLVSSYYSSGCRGQALECFGTPCLNYQYRP